MHSFPVPLVVLGPGSQPVDQELDTLDLPTEMATFRPPVKEDSACPAVYDAALDQLRHLLAAMGAVAYGSAPPVRLSCSDWEPALVAEVNEMLGQGDVSVQAPGAGLHAQETAFTGIWRVRGPGLDLIEASAFPCPLRDCALARPLPQLSAAPAPDGLMNSPVLVAEIRARAQAYQPGQAAQVINLTLLPVTPEDLAYLDQCLGRGDFAILSRGFGNCRITATAYPHVWWVQYFNNKDKLLLNSIEVVDIPAVALAAEEDYRDSRERLAEWLQCLESSR